MLHYYTYHVNRFMINFPLPSKVIQSFQREVSLASLTYLLARNSLTHLNPQQSQNLMQEAKDDVECLGLEKVFELMIRPLDAVMLRIDALLLQCLPEMF